MREAVKEFVKICEATLPIEEQIFEFGSFQVEGQEGFADLRPLFPGRKYIGADMRKGPGVDIILDLHNIDLPPDSVSTVIALDTLEHVEYPRKAMDQIYRILKPGGIAVISSVMRFKIHDYPHDYWRFTPEGFKSLLKPFMNSFVSYAGAKKFPHTVVGIGFKGDNPPLDNLTAAIEKWQDKWNDPRGRRKKLWTTIKSKLQGFFGHS